MRQVMTPEAIWHRCVKVESGCLEWQGARYGLGYGHAKHDGKMCSVTRLLWTQLHGAIPTGYLVMHSCDNPPCCNVDHLFLGTHAENMADRNHKGRTAKGDRNGSRTMPHRLRRGDTSGARTHPEAILRGSQKPQSKLKEADIPEIFRMSEQGMSDSAIGKRFGVYTATVWRVRHGRNWKHVSRLAHPKPEEPGR